MFHFRPFDARWGKSDNYNITRTKCTSPNCSLMSGLPGLESGFLGSDKAHGGAPGGVGEGCGGDCECNVR